MKYIKLFLPLIIINIFCLTGFGEEDRARHVRFAKNLFDDKRYFEAISEARKLEIDGNSDGVELFINSCYYKGGQFGSIISGISEIKNDHRFVFKMHEILGHSYLRLGKYNASYRVSELIDYDSINKNEYANLFSMRYLPLVYDNRFGKLGDEIKIAEKYIGLDKDFIKLKAELMKFNEIRKTSPLFSSIASAVVPGSGQIYNGYFSDGLISFVSVFSSAMAGYYLMKQGHEGFAKTAFFFSALFYSGNIYGAYNSSKKFNRSEISKYRSGILKFAGEYDPLKGEDVEEVLR